MVVSKGASFYWDCLFQPVDRFTHRCGKTPKTKGIKELPSHIFRDSGNPLIKCNNPPTVWYTIHYIWYNLYKGTQVGPETIGYPHKSFTRKEDGRIANLSDNRQYSWPKICSIRLIVGVVSSNGARSVQRGSRMDYLVSLFSGNYQGCTGEFKLWRPAQHPLFLATLQ